MNTTGLLHYLPAIYHEDECLGKLLQAFQEVLLDGKPNDIEGLEKKIDSLPNYFDPYQTPETFLPWLSNWTGFALRADLPEDKRRDFIANAISLYRMRGTKANMIRLLEIFTSKTATIKDDISNQPFFFKVCITLEKPDKEYVSKQMAIAHALIEREKPAHTSYRLHIYLEKKMTIKDCCVVGKTTTLSHTKSCSEEQKNG